MICNECAFILHFSLHPAAMLVLVTLGLVTLVATQRVVDTQYGQVRSHVVNVNNGREETTVDVYYGIPYGNDTSGPLRFKSPVPPDPWTGILEADTIPPACPQTQFPGFDVGEDCLKMNIYAPTNRSATYPVMVWLYGGAYQAGANFLFPGHFLASRDVIVVTLNYRLGKFGFAFTNTSACPGNAGMWDQAIGLQFVVDNIANFGGDPNRITLFGESAGASSASLHLLSPATNKIFQQAIIESGSELAFWALNPPDSHPETYTYNMAEDLSCLRDTDEEMMDCMRELEWRQIYFNSTFGRCTDGYICLGMAPVVDGPGGFMPQHPGEQRLAGDVMQGPIISGINKEDGSTFAVAVAPLIVIDNCCNRSYFEQCLRNNMVDQFAVRLTNRTVEDVYQAMNWWYSPWPGVYDNNANRDAIVQLVTDAAFGVVWDRQVKDHQSVAPTYSYLYDYMSNRSNSEEWIGTPHGAELDFVWGFPLLRANPEVEEDSNLNGDIPTVKDIEFTLFVQDLWTNFAKTGNPTPTPVENPIDGGPYSWPQFTRDDMTYLYMGDVDIDNRLEYKQKGYYFWQAYLMEMAGDELGITDLWNPIPKTGMPIGEILAELWLDQFRKYLPRDDDFDDFDSY